MVEVFEWIPGYEGLYKVSNFGDVVSYHSGKPKSIYQTVNQYGYRQVKLTKNKIVKHVYVHRLVALVFVPGYEDGMEVNHKDLNRGNNMSTNLEWVTKSQNHKYRFTSRNYVYKVNACPICGKQIANQSSFCLLHREYERIKERWPSAENLRDDLLHLNFKEIGRKYGYSDNNIRKICRKYGLPVNKQGIKDLRNGSVS